MEWNGVSFTYTVTVGKKRWEAFQILKDGSWDTVIYPSIPDANPQKIHGLRGPDGENKGLNWLIGRAGYNPFRRDVIPSGTRVRVILSVTETGQAKSVNWEILEQSPANNLPPEAPSMSYQIAGTWCEWTPTPMVWDGDCYTYMVRIGNNGWEAFQFVMDGSWDKVIYPSVTDATPFTHWKFRGPDNKNRGYNWVIGKNSRKWLGGVSLAAGTRCKVKLYVDAEGKPKRLGWDLYTEHRSDRPTLICLAGLASGSLEVVNKKSGSTSVGWCRVRELVESPAKVLRSLSLKLVDGNLRDGTTVKCTACPSDDYVVRPVKGIDGIKSLSPPGSIPIPVWAELVDQLEADFKWHAFAYDWRKWGDEVFAEETVQRFKREVEDIIWIDKPSSGKASLIGHSMGTTVIMYVLSVIGDSWVKSHIDQIILVAPAHTGSPSMVSSFAHCPFVDTQSWLPVPSIFDNTLGDLTASWACMIAELPTKVGGVAPWPEDHVFAVTPKREYRLADMGEFLADLDRCKPHRELGPALWPSACKLAAAVRPPKVPCTIIYADSSQTPVQVTYPDNKLGNAPKLSKTAPGDGTIDASSVEVVAREWQREGAEVRLVKEPAREGTSHKGLICCPFTVSIVPALLEGRKLTPIEVTVVSASNLKNTDGGVTGISDPYVRFHVIGKPASVRQTEVVKNNLHPVWNYTDHLYNFSEGDTLCFSVYDMDTGCTDGDLLGRVIMQPDQVKAGFDGELGFCGDDPGTLRVRVRALPQI